METTPLFAICPGHSRQACLKSLHIRLVDHHLREEIVDLHKSKKGLLKLYGLAAVAIIMNLHWMPVSAQARVPCDLLASPRKKVLKCLWRFAQLDLCNSQSPAIFRLNLVRVRL